MKPKKCKHCRNIFAPTRPLQAVCNFMCALAIVDKQREKKARKELAEGRERLKSRKIWEDEAKSAMQLYVRLRDYRMGCCSCDKPSTHVNVWQGSHFRPATNSATRFNLWGINKSCSQCNLWKGGNVGAYRERLIVKIGIKKVLWLESQNHVVKYSIEYMKRIKAIFTKRARTLKRRLENV